jgi:hypothetical protein
MTNAFTHASATAATLVSSSTALTNFIHMLAIFVLGQSGPVAMWLSVAVGVAALLLAALTDHPTGLVRIIPYWLHLWVDRAVGVVFVIAPFALKFFGLDAWYYWVLAAAVLLTTSVFNAPEQPVAMRLGLDRRTAG